MKNQLSLSIDDKNNLTLENDFYPPKISLEDFDNLIIGYAQLSLKAGILSGEFRTANPNIILLAKNILEQQHAATATSLPSSKIREVNNESFLKFKESVIANPDTQLPEDLTKSDIILNILANN